MGNKQAKDGPQYSKSEVWGEKKKEKLSNVESDQMMEKFNAVITKKKAAFYSSNLKSRDFTQMMTQVKVPWFY